MWRNEKEPTKPISIPAEWLHKSAFSFGGLGDRSGVASSQVVDNMILGTATANTAILRVKDFIKRWVIRTSGKAVVNTEVAHFAVDFGDIKPGWMGDELLYSFTCYQPNSTTPAYPETKIKFRMREVVKPLRLDFELGRLFEEYIFKWNTPLPEDDYETEEESKIKTGELVKVERDTCST
ncbi:hypothetical protein GQ44DRAFT_769538 [Phaeosphaeriaceae sp. PMI808]|nr:hypothetical protein GQ44DRAFT_769538 [Phaeosphaeriaceae sp. PMI808]